MDTCVTLSERLVELIRYLCIMHVEAHKLHPSCSGSYVGLKFSVILFES